MRNKKMTATLSAILLLAAVGCGGGQAEDESSCELRDVDGQAALTCSVEAAWARAAVSEQDERDEAASATDTHLMAMTASMCPKVMLADGHVWCFESFRNGFCYYGACQDVAIAPR